MSPIWPRSLKITPIAQKIKMFYCDDFTKKITVLKNCQHSGLSAGG